jgi:hypothetical protein
MDGGREPEGEALSARDGDESSEAGDFGFDDPAETGGEDAAVGED